MFFSSPIDLSLTSWQLLLLWEVRRLLGGMCGSDLEDLGDNLEWWELLDDLSTDFEAGKTVGLSSDLWHGGKGGFDSKLWRNKINSYQIVINYMIYLNIWWYFPYNIIFMKKNRKKQHSVMKWSLNPHTKPNHWADLHWRRKDGKPKTLFA